MVSGEVWFGYTRPERSSRIERTASVEHGAQLGDEQCQANGDRGKRSGFVFLGSDHKNNKDKKTRAECLNEDSLSDRRALRKPCDDRQFTREHALHESGCDYAT